MPSQSRILYPLLIVATGINVLGLPLAVAQSEPWHATLHAVLALACGFWALRLRYRRAASDEPAGPSRRGLGDGEHRRQLEEGESGPMRDQWLKDRPVSHHEEHRGKE